MSETKQRRKLLRQLLLTGRGGSTQTQLADALAERGLQTTQSTISRDLKLLGAQRRVREDGSFVYRLEGSDAARFASPSRTSADGLSREGPAERGRDRDGSERSSFPSGMVLAIEHNEVTVVVRTRVGRAPAVGLELDALRHPDILGTIAGDDTVVVIPRSIARVAELASALSEFADLG